jgi:hypothetical protein
MLKKKTFGTCREASKSEKSHFESQVKNHDFDST